MGKTDPYQRVYDLCLKALPDGRFAYWLWGAKRPGYLLDAEQAARLRQAIRETLKTVPKIDPPTQNLANGQ